MTATTSLTILPPDDVDNDVVPLPSLMLMTIALMTLLPSWGDGLFSGGFRGIQGAQLPHRHSLEHVYDIHYATNRQYQWIMNMPDLGLWCNA